MLGNVLELFEAKLLRLWVTDLACVGGIERGHCNLDGGQLKAAVVVRSFWHHGPS